jgi:TPR repeat protein
VRKAKTYFEMAAKNGNVNALYNMGCLYLSSTSTKSQLKNVTFSFRTATTCYHISVNVKRSMRRTRRERIW